MWHTISGKIKALQKTGYFYLLLAMVLGQMFAFSQKILISRWLSNEDFGRFSLLVETNILMGMLMTMALPSAMIRFGLLEERLEHYVAGTFRLFLSLSLITLCGFYLINLFWPVFEDHVTGSLINYTVLLAPLLALFNYMVSYLTARKRIRERSFFVFLQRFVYFAAIVVGCFLAGWKGTIAGYVICLVLFGLVLYMRFFRVIHTGIESFPYFKILRFTFWSSLHQIGATGAFFLILTFSERILLDLVLISQLSIAFTFTIIAKIAFASLHDVLFPFFVEKRRQHEFLQLFRNIMLIFLIISLVVLFVSYTAIPFLIDYLLGERYSASIPIFRFVVLGEILVGFSLFFEMVLEILGCVKYKAINMIVTIVILLGVLSPFLKAYGIRGAAYAFLVYSVVRISFNLVGIVYYLILKPEYYFNVEADQT